MASAKEKWELFKADEFAAKEQAFQEAAAECVKLGCFVALAELKKHFMAEYQYRRFLAKQSFKGWRS